MLQAVGAGLHDVAKLLLDAQADPTIGGKAIGMQNNSLHQAREFPRFPWPSTRFHALLAFPRASTPF